MFRIFRKLRLAFLQEGKVKSYLLYACGEIILIVLGILIALQLNNLNESRKEQQRLMTTLEAMTNDLKLNQQKFDTLQEGHIKYLAATELLFNVHLNGEVSIESEASLMNAFRFASYFPPLTYSESAYQLLLTNNRFEKLSSPKLKGMLDEYFRRISWLVAQQTPSKALFESMSNDIYLHTVITPGGSNSPVHKRSTAGIEKDNDGTGEDEFTITYDLDTFRADKALNGKLFDMLDIHKDRIGMLKSLSLLTQEMLPLLQAEINSI